MAVAVKNVKLQVEPESWYGPLPRTDAEAAADLRALYRALSQWEFRTMELIHGQIVVSAYDDESSLTESMFWSLEVSGHTVELLGGRIVVYPRPTAWHEELRVWLTEQVDGLCQVNGWVQQSNARLAVLAGGEDGERLDVLAPDLVVVAPEIRGREAAAAKGPGRTQVPVDQVLLAAEVLAPSSQRADQQIKPAAFARAGIPVYLLAGPISVTVFSGPTPAGYGQTVTVPGHRRQLYLPVPFDLTLNLSTMPPAEETA